LLPTGFLFLARADVRWAQNISGDLDGFGRKVRTGFVMQVVENQEPKKRKFLLASDPFNTSSCGYL
jgi:hypothetical protein